MQFNIRICLQHLHNSEQVFAPQLNFVTNPARFLHILCLFLYKFLQASHA